MKLKSILILAILLFTVSSSNKAFAHCEIPCGIYGDSVRVTILYEHFTTIEKSMKKIVELSAEKSVNYNQLVRWVNNKEEHALKVQDIVSQYFLHQRIKIKDETDAHAYKLYQDQLIALHKISVYSMKAKQTTDTEWVEKLRSTLAEFEGLYFHGHKH